MQQQPQQRDLQQYYARRALEYERIYHKPERQQDLLRLQERLPGLLEGFDVLEIACGTGYWTQFVARCAASVLATDINDEVLALARLKAYPRDNVTLARADIYSDDQSEQRFGAGLAAFWWSHVPRQDQDRFIAHFHRRLHDGAMVVLVDNRYVKGSSTPVSRTDEHGNTYQTRALDDGKCYEVLKNFPREPELRSALGARARDLAFVDLDYFWYATYRVAEPG